jgi:mono/diheme cytochrome c family protein
VRLADRPALFRASDFAEVVRKGKGRMPAFEAYKDEDIAAVLAFLRAVGR